MYTLSIAFSFLSVIGLYATSDRLEIQKNYILRWFFERTDLAYLLAGLSFIFSTLLLIDLIGTAAGILASIILWMLIASSLVFFAPLKKVGPLHLGLTLLVLNVVETLIIPMLS